MNMGRHGHRNDERTDEKKERPSLDQLFDHSAQLGVEIKVCEMSMDLMGFKHERSSTTRISSMSA